MILFSLLFLTGCDIIAGIFKTGVGVGIFIAVLIPVIIFLIVRARRK